ncbi:hypothetical protein [uncultured Nocardioides sp.]|uniref:hypothetical protein n=1 Tax=uncultured Nocardioides sp. TaxID=198441 RepID=UPI00261996D1|nr:hypothetical protein [uncultured Nocardioides sp.]
MTRATKKMNELERWQVDASIAVAGIVIAALAGVLGALGGAKLASSATDRQISNDQIAVLRQERVTTFAEFLSRLDRRIDPSLVPVEETDGSQTDLWREERRAYESALQAARLYASQEQLVLVNELDGLIIDIVDSSDEVEAEARANFSASRAELYELLRKDLQFSSDS